MVRKAMLEKPWPPVALWRPLKNYTKVAGFLTLFRLFLKCPEEADPKGQLLFFGEGKVP